ARRPRPAATCVSSRMTPTAGPARRRTSSPPRRSRTPTRRRPRRRGPPRRSWYGGSTTRGSGTGSAATPARPPRPRGPPPSCGGWATGPGGPPPHRSPKPPRALRASMRRSDAVKRLKRLHAEMRPSLLSAGVSPEKADAFIEGLGGEGDEEIVAYTERLLALKGGAYRDFMKVWGLKTPEWWANMA